MRFVLLLAIISPAFSQAPIRGFPADQWKTQHDLEEKAKAVPQAERLRIYMERMADKPHHAGSPGAKAVADYALGQLKEWGLDARIESFEAMLPYPAARVLEMTAPVRYRAQIKEPAFPEDKYTAEAGTLAPYNAYSASGDVTAPLVYVNYGLPEDYESLKKLGIEVRGKIVIARYGKSWRGIKPKLAQENGAVGCLIYSDPRDDGYFQNDVYPKGPMRPPQGVQRGSVLDMTLYPGDPLSPGWASEHGSRRLPRSDAKSLPKIPVMPISYGDAKPLLEQRAGPVAPEPWRGALPITYHTGPGPATVHLKLDFDWSNRPLEDVVARIPGTVYKDQWILYGNHHDAWVNGASDPVSGACVLLETARTLASLRKQGWQPKRTVVLALWDGEEFGLVGSTEWVEKHLDELERKAAVYINSDSNGRGSIGAGGSYTLETFTKEVLRELTDPVTSKSLLDSPRRRRRAQLSADGSPHEFQLAPLGAGSDYVPFLDHAGVASLNLGFGGPNSSGVYHSAYDTIAWYQRFSDGDFAYGKTLSQLLVTMVLRLADAPVLPFEFQSLFRTIHRYVDEIQKDVQRTSGAVDFREVQSQLARLHTASRLYDDELAAVMRRAGPMPLERLAKVNEAVQRTERAQLLSDGLPRREWYRHQLYAPGLYTGYGAKTLPGVREAIEAQRWEEANQQARRLAQVLRATALQVEEAARLLTSLSEARP
jgi:N-acetylated-alpha-linked acidic dipeptidase